MDWYNNYRLTTYTDAEKRVIKQAERELKRLEKKQNRKGVK
jgi:hypothetical protein